jgi:hypothetical protein
LKSLAPIPEAERKLIEKARKNRPQIGELESIKSVSKKSDQKKEIEFSNAYNLTTFFEDEEEAQDSQEYKPEDEEEAEEAVEINSDEELQEEEAVEVVEEVADNQKNIMNELKEANEEQEAVTESSSKDRKHRQSEIRKLKANAKLEKKKQKMEEKKQEKLVEIKKDKEEQGKLDEKKKKREEKIKFIVMRLLY